MTGFGKATAQLPLGWVTVEIRSLNSKFLDLNLRLPKMVQDKEYLIRNKLTAAIERGKVNFSINLEKSGEESQSLINHKLVKAYFKELSALADELGQNKEQLLASILRLPEINSAEQLEDDSWWPALDKLIDTALLDFDKFRHTEGLQTARDMETAVQLILEKLAQVDPYEQERVGIIRLRLAQGLDSWLEEEKIDKNRLEQELIFYLEKLDISEEKQRLKQHCQFFVSSLQEKSGGKKLGFITQEMGREINTLGSKSNHVAIQKLVVDMKNELEKIKEQVLNIL
jgi:uncharacterized protein (TIGR00255 family)